MTRLAKKPTVLGMRVLALLGVDLGAVAHHKPLSIKELVKDIDASHPVERDHFKRFRRELTRGLLKRRKERIDPGPNHWRIPRHWRRLLRDHKAMRPIAITVMGLVGQFV